MVARAIAVEIITAIPFIEPRAECLDREVPAGNIEEVALLHRLHGGAKGRSDLADQLFHPGRPFARGPAFLKQDRIEIGDCLWLFTGREGPDKAADIEHPISGNFGFVGI